MKWRIVNLPDVRDNPAGYREAIRLNSLGSLFFFTRFLLKKDRLATLHWHLCRSLEAEDLHLVMEVSMSFFKTVLGIGLSMFWALPFDDDDDKHMRLLGYGDAWIRYMRTIHNQNTRTLITHEVDSRAVEIGKEVDDTYMHNDLFRAVFSEILPDGSATWNDHSKFQKRKHSRQNDPTTATYTYCGVGHALQGIHPDRTIQDDNMGKAAQDSMLRGDGRVLDGLIRWHRQLTTRLDTAKENKEGLGSQLVIGNRWGHADLNSWIRDNQPQFTFETHDAEGGCCGLHPTHGKPIFPEEWPWERLKQKEQDLGPYDYAHFFRNLSTLPEECTFKKEWLHYFKFKQSRPDLALEDIRNILLLEHEVSEGEVIDDFQPGTLTMRMIVDPNHAKKTKRYEHCIWVVGYDSESTRIYLLDLWAEDSSYSDLVGKVYETGRRWKLDNFWMGTLAAQLLKFYIEQRDRIEKQPMRVNVFPDDDSTAGMKNRIEALEPIFRERQVWAHRNQSKFISQFESYPAGTVCTLDTLANFPATIDVVNTKRVSDFLTAQQEQFAKRESGAGGY